MKKCDPKTDSFNATKVVVRGSMKPDLGTRTRNKLKFCELKNIKLFPQWVPRTQNILADKISKYSDNEDYSICNNYFKIFDRI